MLLILLEVINYVFIFFFLNKKERYIFSGTLWVIPINFYVSKQNLNWSSGNIYLLPTNPCKKSQHWVENADGPPQCIDCQACPPGQTISPECGNSKPLTPDTTVFCVPCQLGKSFSKEFSTSVCIPCSSCSKDQVVMKNCSRQADIECGKRCYSKDRYIM